jgi:hypothetical protein
MNKITMITIAATALTGMTLSGCTTIDYNSRPDRDHSHSDRDYKKDKITISNSRPRGN